MTTYSIQTGWNNKVPIISKTEIIALNQKTARQLLRYLKIDYIHLSWVVKEISAKDQTLPHNEKHWLRIYNLIAN